MCVRAVADAKSPDNCVFSLTVILDNHCNLSTSKQCRHRDLSRFAVEERLAAEDRPDLPAR